jgi:hypothetical protein
MHFLRRSIPLALVIGPTGVGLGLDVTLYAADTLNSRIASIPNAVTRVTSGGTGATVAQGNGLNRPLGLAIDQGTRHIFTVNAVTETWSKPPIGACRLRLHRLR